MKTVYAACLSRIGLSQPEAAAMHGVRLDTVKSWGAGRNPVPQGAWDDLRRREALIVARAESIREAWEDAGETRNISVQWADDVGLLGLADFVLTEAVLPS